MPAALALGLGGDVAEYVPFDSEILSESPARRCTVGA
jgi:hypothetical protein